MTPSNNEEMSILKKEVCDLNEQLKVKEKMLEDERETQKKLKQAVKKPSVLDLELEAYEKTLDEINKKLEAKKKQVVELEGTIAVQNETINSLKNQISTLEENLESEKGHATELKKNLDAQLSLLRKTEHERTEANLQLELLRKNFEGLKLENSESKIEMSKTVGDMEKRHQQLETERNNLTTNVSFLESEVEKYRKLSSSHEKEIENLRSEFVSYKIRAQSVLRQNQTKDLSREQELQDEVITLQSSLESLKESNQKLSHELENLKKNYSDLVEDKVRLQGRCKELLTTLEKQSEEMLEESRKRNQEHDESVKAYQLQIDTLNTFYKKRTQELEDTKKSAIAELNEKIILLEKASHIPSTPVASAFESPPRENDHKMSSMLDLMDREVEGSEDQSSQSTYAFTSKRKTSRNRELIPLDELLNSSFDDNSNEVNDETISNYSSRSEVLEHLRAKLQKEENRVTHLTALLSDSEKDLAKMQQLNEMLKEEVRRHQRSIEREQHIQNSEYLKNIVMKFVTLNNGDEKQRLIPVLNTILKLSSEELQTLNNACKGGWGLWNK
jgi:chromosome segregation ATPase